MEDRSYRRNRALATPLAHVRGFPANEIECALISMMARSIVKRSTDRSDTLVQDPTSPAERLSPCNTPPVHTMGSRADSGAVSEHDRWTLCSGIPRPGGGGYGLTPSWSPLLRCCSFICHAPAIIK